MNTERFGAVVRLKREEKKLSRAKLADVIGIGASYLVQIEAGEKTPAAEIILAIARALDMDSGDLFRLLDDNPAQPKKLPDEFDDFQLWLSGHNVTARDLKRIRQMVSAYLREDEQ